MACQVLVCSQPREIMRVGVLVCGVFYVRMILRTISRSDYTLYWHRRVGFCATSHSAFSVMYSAFQAHLPKFLVREDYRLWLLAALDQLLVLNLNYRRAGKIMASIVKLIEGFYVWETLAILCSFDDNIIGYLNCALRRLLIYHRSVCGDLIRWWVKLLWAWSFNTVEKTPKPPAIIVEQSRVFLFFTASCKWIRKNYTSRASSILQYGLPGFRWLDFIIKWFGSWWNSFADSFSPDLLRYSPLPLRETFLRHLYLGDVTLYSSYKRVMITGIWPLMMTLLVTTFAIFGSRYLLVICGGFASMDFTKSRATVLLNPHKIFILYCL